MIHLLFRLIFGAVAEEERRGEERSRLMRARSRMLAAQRKQRKMIKDKQNKG